jgi:hypothetical protein
VSIGVFARQGYIALGNAAGAHSGEPNAIDCLTKLDDWQKGLGVTEQLEIGCRVNQTDLSRPSKKRLPVSQQLIGLLGQVVSRGIAEIERQVSADRMGNQPTRNEGSGGVSRSRTLNSRRYRLRHGRFRHRSSQYHLTG